MGRFLLLRVIQSLLTLFAVMTIVFALARLSGDPISLIIDPTATADDRALEMTRLGLDRPVNEQYGLYLWNALHGQFGQSIFFKESALQVFMERLPASLELGLAALLICLGIAIPIGVLSAVFKDSLFDRIAQLIAMLGQSTPIFSVGLIAILVFSVELGLFPTSGREGLSSLVLPAITLGWYGNALLMRITRSSMLGVLESDYIKLARLEGISETTIIWKYAFRNASTSILTTFGLITITMLTGAVVTETVFAWPGVGRLIVDSIFHRDFPVVQAAVTLLASLVIVVNLLVDLLYLLIDPRLRT
jgi:peptide/nickel transport system permease protein